MKKLIVLCAVFICSATYAKPKSEAKENHIIEVCKGFGMFANTTMYARQHDVAMSEMLKSANNIGAKLKPQLPSGGALFRDIVSEAYEEPRYQTQEYQDNAVRDFENKIFKDCYDNAPR